ncbi:MULTISPECIES: DUF4197 domain-containing protein [Sphingobium]|jgi:hypothetical protein|uniref:DUF4197 domain-containing protein n=1 Tax=Sphingobium limneticum TaxID=1007511 RepID=A0A5J5HXW4_9SPHN|nr:MULTISPECIES: DUF4197 domain-containing protein [Sphingobium]MBU0930456.1 DUF4197 domain-containing protein [Alphaproteobacteria bacterium]KAA9011720.1 DUF4197 domain-containing protein [Sphingobium limneticum]KAA9013510.1 DUF4197 domain-containing protein [Sphingobium limneticum]KAA9026572.1 DUF4197 domain-containing protein [Sphingobium limneticum]BBD02397.1 hypothetical protein YGS_C2P0411 [Sphingobium sp. YG1]
MDQSIGFSDRRSLIATLALLPLAACATPMGRYTVEDAVRRLLQLSSERAFARLTEPGGFYDDQLTRIVPPDLNGGKGGAVLSALLRTNAVRNQVARSLNDVAVDLADNATPIVMDAVQRMTLADAVSVLRGGPTAATDLLARQARGSVVEALMPGASRALRSDMFEMLSAALSASGGKDYAALADNVSGQIGDAIFRAIGREEAEIRRDPGATRDPILMALLR